MSSLLCWRAAALLFVLRWILTYGLPAHKMALLGEKLAPSAEVLMRAHHPRTLVVSSSPHKDSSWRSENSEWLSFLQSQGHELHFSGWHQLYKSSVFLLKHGEPLYDNLILVDYADDPQGVKLQRRAETVSSAIAEFVEKHNKNLLILGTSTSAKDTVVQHLMLWLEFKPLEVPAEDSFRYCDGDVRTVKSDRILKSEGIFSKTLQSESVCFAGVPHTLPGDNVLAFPLVRSMPTMSLPDRTQAHSVNLVSALQTRTNTRVVISGSRSLCSDSMRQNSDFCRELALWTFQQKGVVEWANLNHQKAVTVKAPTPASGKRPHYRMGDDVDLSIDLYHLNGTEYTSWTRESSLPVQMEFTMLDPYYRLFLRTEARPYGSVTPGVTFKAPDKYGIFKFVLRLKAKGYSFLHLETLAPVRNHKHTDYERFMMCATPYYASTFMSLALVVLFVSMFSHCEE